jgi:tRNA modification GTPase
MADIVLWLEPTDGLAIAPLPAGPARAMTIRVRSKSDLAGYPVDSDTDAVPVSTLTGAGIPALLERLKHACADLLSGEDPVVASARQEETLCAAVLIIDRALAEAGHGAEIVAENLRQLVRTLDGLVGRIDVERVLGEVFSRFCLGK